jgi:serine/threonine protein phosphatase PrpC
MIDLDTAVLTSAGGRQQEEDFAGFLVLQEFACWALADGLGGHRGGATAAQLAVDATLTAFRGAPGCASETLAEYFTRANQAIAARQKEEPRLAEMRSTLVVLVSDFHRAVWGHMGDSRLYYFKRGKVFFQTKDHSVPQALCNAGEITFEQIRFHEDRNRLLRCLGSEEAGRPVIGQTARAIEAQDAFLLCTDGFWEHVTESDMEEALGCAAGAEDWLKNMEATLKRRATGAYDNYSAIAVWPRRPI